MFVMTLQLRVLTACLLAVGLASCGGGSNGTAPQSPAGTSGSAGATFAASDLLAVANATNNSVTVFAGDANGDVAPVRSISGPHTALANPTDVTADSGGNLYVVNNGATPFSITVYAPPATGDATPLRVIAGSATALEFPVYARVDANGTLYVSNAGRGGPFSKVTEYAAGANGNVPPARVLPFEDPATGLHCFFPGPLAIDAAGDLLVASNPVSNPVSNPGEIAAYAPGATDCTKPLRVLTGAQTRLTSPSGLALTAVTGSLVVSDIGSLPGQVLEFPSTANGNAPPSVVIGGASSGLSRPAGVAVDAAGSIYVANTGANSITVFAPTATGNAVPIRTIAGPHTGLASPAGIALAPRP
jgi:hypothetical protein